MKRSYKLALIGAAVVSWLGVSFAMNFADHPYFSHMRSGRLVVFSIIWALVSYGPLVVSTALWSLAAASKLPWLFHALLLPGFYGLLLAGNYAMMFILQVPDLDDSLGAPIMPAFLCMVFSAIAYYLALVAKPIMELEARSSGK